MKKKTFVHVLALILATWMILLPARLSAQSTGSVDFVALVSPTGGQPEPVRQLTFYLLRKSVVDIRKEALQQVPAMDLDNFIVGLDISPELKTWMKKHRTVRLTGEDSTKGLTPEDIVDTPEYFKAYMLHNEAYRGAGFPEPKFTEKEKVSNPEKYQDQKDQYKAAIRKFIAGAPSSVQGMDLELVDINPYAKWESVERKERQSLDTRVFGLAEQRYLVARTTTDLDGRGSFPSVPPGTYWIGMLGAEAISGDVHLHWDFPVTVRQGQTASVELSNLNATRSSAMAQNSDN